MKLPCSTIIVVAFAFLITLSMCGIAGAAAIVIDDFSTPDPAPFFLVGINQPNSLPVEQAGLSEAVGGERDILVSVLGTAGPQSAHMLTGFDPSLFVQGVIQIATAGSPGTTVTLQYDGTDADGGTLSNSRLLQLDLTSGGSNDRIEVDFLSVDAPAAPGLDMVITLTSTGGSAVFTDLVPEAGSPATRVAPFASFMADPGFSFSDVDSLELQFNGSGVMDVDFVVSGIRAVPEPATGVLLLAGVCALSAGGYRRCQRSLVA